MHTISINSDHIDFNDQFIFAYELLENTQNNVFVTGKAGTGKSTLLEYFRDNSKKQIAVLAPTGVAAVNVQGQTIHSFFRFKPDITPDTVSDIKIRKKQKEIYKKIDTIVIDEISMVRADLLDCIDVFLRIHGKNSNEPFGGVQMLFFGDLYQLPPVVTHQDREIFQNVYESPYFFDSNIFKELDFEVIELEQIYRQREEGFIKLLSRIRNNSVSQDNLKQLNTRFMPDFQPQEDDLYIYLTTTNALADKINQEQLNALKTRPYHCEGEIVGKFEERILPTHLSLDLKFNAQVMLLNNDPNGRWINGSIGKVASVIEDEGEVFVVNVELSDGTCVEVLPFTWEMFKFVYNEETESLESESIGAFTQFPLKLAWAVTIHKSQGMTFPKIVVDIGKGTFSHGQTYVALSRCSTFEGLVLKKPIQKRHILMDWRVVKFMNKIKNQANKECYV